MPPLFYTAVRFGIVALCTLPWLLPMPRPAWRIIVLGILMGGGNFALMFIALDKLHNQGLKQAIIVVPEKSIGSSFADEPLAKFGFWADWTVAPRWNLCNSPGGDSGKVGAVGKFLASDDKILVCTHATFRFAVDKFGIEAFDDRLIAVDEFHHVSANPDNSKRQFDCFAAVSIETEPNCPKVL